MTGLLIAFGIGVVGAVAAFRLPARGWAALGLAFLPILGFWLTTVFC